MPCIDSAMDHDSGRQLRALSEAGYKLEDLGWYPEQDDVIARRHRFGDKHSWIIDLPTQGVTASKLPDGATASSAFTIIKQGNDDSERFEGPSYTQGFNDKLLVSPVIRHPYMMQYKAGPKYDKKIKFLERRLYALTISELAKLKHAERPHRYDDTGDVPHLLRDSRFLKGFTKPSTWMYYDEEVDEFLDRLEKEVVDKE
jgi:hypothetical protein